MKEMTRVEAVSTLIHEGGKEQYTKLGARRFGQALAVLGFMRKEAEEIAVREEYRDGQDGYGLTDVMDGFEKERSFRRFECPACNSVLSRAAK